MSLSIKTYSIREAAKLLEVRPAYISTLISDGNLDFFLPPGRCHKRIPHNSLLNFINNNTFNSKEVQYDKSEKETGQNPAYK